MFRRISILNVIAFGLLIWVLAVRAPQWIALSREQGAASPTTQVRLLDGSNLSLPLNEKHVVVFWATWCTPCTVELKRINDLIENKKISADNIVAVSLLEDPVLVARTSRERQYKFRVAVDRDGATARLFNVSATPTIALVDEAGVVRWKTMGLSPTLELRLKSFLN